MFSTRPAITPMRTTLLVALASLVSLAAAAPETDPRLGPPFEKRERLKQGSDQAPIVVVEFGSYKCGHCYEFHERSFPELQAKFVETGKVQWFFVPCSDHPADSGGQIFLIGHCFAEQKKWWDQLGFLMTISRRPPSVLMGLVRKNPAIDLRQLDLCLQQPDTRVAVGRNFEEFQALKIPGTPTFVIRKLHADGTRTETIVRGYQPPEYFSRVFDELAKAP